MGERYRAMIKRLLIFLAALIAATGLWISPSALLSIIFAAILGMLVIVLFVAMVVPSLGCAGVDYFSSTIGWLILIGGVTIILIKLSIIGVINI